AERRRAEAERARLMTAIEQAAEAVVITDPEGKIEYVNPAFTWMTDYTREEALGQNPRLLKSGQHEPLFYQMLWETIRAGNVWQGELINRRKDGSLYTEEMSITPVRGADGQITHFIALKQDITERKRAQEEHVHALHLQAENEALTRANQMKSEFLTDMSHELRSPLNSILGFSELLLENAAGLTPEQREDLAIVHRKAEHLLALVNDLLDLSRIEAGQVELERTAIPVREYLVSVLDAFAVHLREKNLQAKVEVEPPDLQVYADARRLEEILTNLTVNALRYTERGGLVLRAWGRRGHVLFSVEDTGIGIAPEVQKRVFDKFYQARQQAEGGKEGTGLGLAITLRLVELHGGRIWLESAPGQGTRFFFTLPNAFPPGRLSPRQANG
ncbi:MAG: ATP-binding protein, partial [Terriglobia bacterium]